MFLTQYHTRHTRIHQWLLHITYHKSNIASKHFDFFPYREKFKCFWRNIIQDIQESISGCYISLTMSQILRQSISISFPIGENFNVFDAIFKIAIFSKKQTLRQTFFYIGKILMQYLKVPVFTENGNLGYWKVCPAR